MLMNLLSVLSIFVDVLDAAEPIDDGLELLP